MKELLKGILYEIKLNHGIMQSEELTEVADHLMAAAKALDAKIESMGDDCTCDKGSCAKCLAMVDQAMEVAK